MKAKFITTSIYKKKETNAKLYIETDTTDELINIKISMRELNKLIKQNLIKTTETNQRTQTKFYQL